MCNYLSVVTQSAKWVAEVEIEPVDMESMWGDCLKVFKIEEDLAQILIKTFKWAFAFRSGYTNYTGMRHNSF